MPYLHNETRENENNNMVQNMPPSGYKQLTEVQIAKCLTMKQFGLTQSQIAQEIGCSQSTVQRVLGHYDYQTFVEKDTHPGRPRKTSEKDDDLIIITAKRNSRLPLGDITNIIGLPISSKTVTRRLKEVGLVSRYAAKKPFLTSKHKKDRLEWAMKYKDWTVEDWLKVIFSDECMMRVGVPARRQRVIRRQGSALQEQHLTPTFKSQRVSIMIWGCFSGDRLGPCITLEQGGVDTDAYMEILYDGLFGMIEDVIGAPDNLSDSSNIDADALLFMHDNAPCHSSQDIKDLLEEHHISVMKWPAQSPDLNPIENLWQELKDRFYKKWRQLRQSPSASSASYEKYCDMIQECWRELSGDYIRSLIESMPKRCAEVIAAKGGHIKY